MNYIDRNNIAAARLAGLEKDLGLVGVQYQASCFLASQICAVFQLAVFHSCLIRNVL